jgi:3-dehydro-L-gulonate 2-dehydrogenase
MQQIPFQDLFCEFRRVLAKLGLNTERAELVARLFTNSQRDGVYSHALNRFPALVSDIKNGRIDIDAQPQKTGGLGVIEQWDGKLGIGQWNAHVCMERAIAIAHENGMGCVGLRNTNHWMRGGSYGLQATDAGCVGICWTNTIPLMPPWGSAVAKIGNNPFVIAIPRVDGPLLLDMAMSQYSKGKLDVFKRLGKDLAVAGGYDCDGRLTRNPAAILSSGRLLPIGHWKGSALTVMLDSLAALVSGGRASHQIGRDGVESAVSQVFIAIDIKDGEKANRVVDAIVDDLHTAAPLCEDEGVRYPGEGMLRIRRDSVANGVLVDEEQFAALLAI